MPSSKKPIITVSDLHKHYQNAPSPALSGVSFYVEPGTFFSLLGPNGAGKTTILSILTTILNPTQGRVTVAGLDVVSQSSAVRHRIGVIFQNPSLDLNLTAEENLRFHANLYDLYPYRPFYRWMPLSYRRRIQKLALLLGLNQDLHRQVKTFSGGMKRKLEIIRSLMHQPKILFLDEPTTGLDPLSRQNLWQYLRTIQRQKHTTIFLTTHYLEEAEASDYLCVINHGQVVAKGTPQELKQSLLQDTATLDSPHRRQLTAELKSQRLRFSGTGPFVVTFPRGFSPGLIQTIKTPLNLLQLHQPTLEDAYLKIISHD